MQNWTAIERKDGQSLKELKKHCYRAKGRLSGQRPEEDVDFWLPFFLSCMSTIQSQLMTKLHKSGLETQLFAQGKINFYDYLKPSEDSVGENCRYLHQV